MMAAVHHDSLIDRLPTVRGRYVPEASLADLTWFRTGGPAEVLFTPADADDLAEFLKGCPVDVPVTVIGVGSNLLVRDGGLDGVTIRLGRGFNHIEVSGNDISCGASALDAQVAKVAAQNGLTGLEFLSGIPGSIGGALRMNAGAYQGETRDAFVSARAVSAQGDVITLGADDMGFAYRSSDVPADMIFIDARFRAKKGDPSEINTRMAEIKASRTETQPIRNRTGGSTFKNPEGHKSWQLIDAAGCRGLSIGDAQVSELHCNFLLNHGGASALDIETLGETVRKRVHEHSGIDLQWEIKRIGNFKPGEGIHLD